MDELLLLIFLMREKIAVVRFLEEQVLEGIVIFRTYLIGFHHMVVDICLGITEKLVRQILVGRKLVDFYLTNIPAAALLSAIAQDKAVTSILSQDFISRHNLPAASSVSLALKTLINREFIYKYNGSYIIYDRFFGMWLRKNCAASL
jgi:hypothetical protein